MTITGEQVKEARRLLGWTQLRLASRIGISAPVLRNFERDGRQRWAFKPTAAREVLEAAGVEFGHESAGAAVVRLKSKTERPDRSVDEGSGNGDRSSKVVQP